MLNESTDKATALRFLEGLEGGGMTASESRILAESLDPVLVHLTVRFLREVYPASNPAASAVLERLMKLTSAYPELVHKTRVGEQDPVSEWFAAAHSFREFSGRGRELIETIVDKLET